MADKMCIRDRGENDLALGNVIGSNIFNILLILGASSTIVQVNVGLQSLYDIIILIGVSLITYLFSLRGRQINRLEGAFMLALYGGYLAYIILRCAFPVIRQFLPDTAGSQAIPQCFPAPASSRPLPPGSALSSR